MSIYTITQDTAAGRFGTESFDITPEDRFQQFKKEILEFAAAYPPIREYTNPQNQLNTIRVNTSRPLNTRNLQPKQIQQLSEIQSKETTQIMAEGKLKHLIEKAVVFNLGSQENLNDLVREFSKLYGFTIQTQDYFNQIINFYFMNKVRVDDYFKSRNNDSELIFFEVFGTTIKQFGVDQDGKPLIKVFKGPLGVELFCSNDILNKVLTHISKTQSNAAGFAKFSNVNINGISFPLLYNFNTNGEPDTYSHELTHNWNSLFRRINVQREEFTKNQCLMDIRATQTYSKDKKIASIEEYYKTVLHNYLLHFGDECLAMIKSGDSLGIFFVNRPDNPYDYLKDFRESQSNSLNFHKDEYYISAKSRMDQFQTHDDPVDFTIPYFKQNFIPLNLERNEMIGIRQNLYNNYYLEIAKKVVVKITQILDKKSDINTRKALIGALGVYPDVELWPDILDKMLIEL